MSASPEDVKVVVDATKEVLRAEGVSAWLIPKDDKLKRMSAYIIERLDYDRARRAAKK